MMTKNLLVEELKRFLAMLRRRRAARLSPVLLACLALLKTLDASAVGFRLPNQDPEAIARGNAFVATADDPAAIYYNPAGITQLSGYNVQAGLYLVSGDITYKSATGATAKNDDSFQPVPQFYFVDSISNTPVSIGLGVYVPYGLSVNWGYNTSFRTLAEKGSLRYESINPVAAWQICPSLSIAAGPTINYSKAKFERGVTPAFLSTSDKFSFVGDDVTYGFNAGIRWQPADMVAFGISYRSETSPNFGGTSDIESPFSPANGKMPATAEIHFPQYVIAGVSFRPTENWNFEVDLDWSDFHVDKQVVFKGTVLGDQTFTLNYRSSWMYEFGATYKLPKGFNVSAGYFYSENSSPDANFNPTVPDADLHLGSIGFGYRGQRVDCGLAYQFAYNGGRHVTGSQTSVPFGETADGTYKVFNQGINLAVNFKF